MEGLIIIQQQLSAGNYIRFTVDSFPVSIWYSFRKDVLSSSAMSELTDSGSNALRTLVLLSLCAIAFGQPLNLDKFTPAQLDQLSALKNVVKNERMEKYMTEDYYLAKFLAISNFNVDVAVKRIQDTLNWRAWNNMSSILYEDWSDMRQRFPYSRETFDKTGKPVVYINLGDWDVAGYFSNGETTENVHRFIRYFGMFAEESELNIQELRGMGRDVTQYMMLINLAGFSVLKQACIQCLYAYRDTVNTLRPNFPYSADKIITFNTPLMYKVVYSYLGTETQNNMELYGQDRAQWEPMLLSLMTPDQFPKGLLEESAPKETDNAAGILQWRHSPKEL